MTPDVFLLLIVTSSQFILPPFLSFCFPQQFLKLRHYQQQRFLPYSRNLWSPKSNLMSLFIYSKTHNCVLSNNSAYSSWSYFNRCSSQVTVSEGQNYRFIFCRCMNYVNTLEHWRAYSSYFFKKLQNYRRVEKIIQQTSKSSTQYISF